VKVPAPPSPIPTVKLVSLAKGTKLYRFFNLDYLPNAFNPCVGRPSRFAPLRDSAKNCVPTLYAGETKECAAFESVFRYVRVPKNKHGTVPFRGLENIGHAELTLNRKLKLACLYGPDQKALGARDSVLTRAAPKHYAHTVKWAVAFHDQFKDIHGLVWTSYQCDPNSAYVFFGDRVAPSDFTHGPPTVVLADATLLSEVHAFGLRARIIFIT
jgi:hypothetical protein